MGAYKQQFTVLPLKTDLFTAKANEKTGYMAIVSTAYLVVYEH